MKLNLGCGDRYVEGWINVDHDTPHRADVRIDLASPDPLPWEEGSITHVYAGHLLEHLSRKESYALVKKLLPCMSKDGGVVVAVGPDIPLAKKMIADGTFDFTYHSLESLRDGAGRWAGDVHQWETSGPLVASMFTRAGWPHVRNLGIAKLEGGWPVADPAPQWQYAVRAYTSEDFAS